MALQRQVFGEGSSTASERQEAGPSTRSDGASSSSMPAWRSRIPPSLTPADYGLDENLQPRNSPAHSSDFEFTSSDD